MDISKLVNYEGTYTFSLLMPNSEEPTGITIEVRSSGSAAVRDMVLEHTDKQIERFAKRKLPTAVQGERSEIEKTAGCIVSWNWGNNPKTGEPNLFNGEVPELTKKNAMEFVRLHWVYDQVSEAAGKVANFMSTSAKP